METELSSAPDRRHSPDPWNGRWRSGTGESSGNGAHGRSVGISAARARQDQDRPRGRRRPRRRRHPGQRASGPPESRMPPSTAWGTGHGRSAREGVAHLSASAVARPRRCPPRRTGRPRRAAPPASAHRQPPAASAAASAPRRKSRLRRGDADAAGPETCDRARRSAPARASSPEAPPTPPARAPLLGLAAADACAARGRGQRQLRCTPADPLTAGKAPEVVPEGVRRGAGF